MRVSQMLCFLKQLHQDTPLVELCVIILVWANVCVVCHLTEMPLPDLYGLRSWVELLMPPGGNSQKSLIKLNI